MNLFSPKAQQMIGLDIGTRFVKAVVLEKSADKFTLQAYACEPIAGDAFAEREIKDFEAVSHALKKVKLALKNKSKLVAIAVSGSTVLNKIVYMDPGQSDHELESQIELEADSLIPYPLDEVYIDFEELSASENELKNNKVEVLLSAVHKDIVDRRNTLLGEVGYETKIVDVENYALGSAVAAFHPSKPEQNICCINIGATQLQLCTVKDGQITYTKDHSFGMDALIKDLSMLYSQERSQIEQQLSEDTLPKTWKQDSYPMFLANLQQHINRAIQVYISATSSARPNSILICGGGGHLSSLIEDLSADLGIEVSAFNPFTDMTINEKISQAALDLVSPQLVIAAGLANRSFQPWHI